MSIKNKGCTLYQPLIRICAHNNMPCNFVPKKCTKLNNKNIEGAKRDK